MWSLWYVLLTSVSFLTLIHYHNSVSMLDARGLLEGGGVSGGSGTGAWLGGWVGGGVGSPVRWPFADTAV